MHSTGSESLLSYRLIAVAAAAVLALAGCAQKPVVTPAAVDTLNEDIAKTCTFTPMQPKPGATVESTITMTNDGWCAYRASESDGKAYVLGLVKQRPEHGELQIRKWNGESRVEYYPAAAFVGTDKFTVALRSQTAGVADSLVQITANVAKGEGVAPTAAPIAEDEKPAPTRRARPAARKPARRSAS